MRLLRRANPIVRAVLRSSVHRFLSRRLLLLTYRGRRTGRLFEIPLRYAELEGGRLVAVALHQERKLWWRSLVEVTPVSLVLRGERLDATATLVEGAERDAALAAYAAGSRRIARLSKGAVVVVFTPTR